MMKNFYNQIIKLIDSKREGKYWDFKSEHHTNKAALLHDILCMVNTVTKSDKYIIFGVSDPSSDCEIISVNSDNERSQTDIIDFLRSMNFAGDIRPEIELRRIDFGEKHINVLVIFDHFEKPYFLSKDYSVKGKTVRKNYVYSRNFDTNTPIDKGSDYQTIELMWRERFGLDLQPSQKMIKLLNKPNE